jgi:hypothetical protein
MKHAFVLALVLVAACSAAKPIHPPGESSPASPGSVWTTQGGPASPGAPAMGTVTTADAGADAAPR